MRAFLDSKNVVRNRPGFTLLELLTVIVIIGMLGAMTLAVVTMTQREARISATQGLISRLDEVVSEMYEGYVDKKFNVSYGLSTEEEAMLRLHFLCDTMRMDMPSNWYEALSGPQPYTFDDKNYSLTDPTALHRVYLDTFKNALVRLGKTSAQANDMLVSNAYNVLTIDGETDPSLIADPAVKTVMKNASAKLLYLMIMNGMPEARGMFHERYIAEPDGDGLSVFVDSWGNPIQFLRWAPAFPSSERQPDIWKWTGTTLTRGDVLAATATVDGRTLGGPAAFWCNKLSPDWLTDTYFAQYFDSGLDRKDLMSDLIADYAAGKTVQWTDKINISATQFFSTHWSLFNTMLEYPDPLDVAQVRLSATDATATRSRPGWMLVPMVYSAGPDKHLGAGDDVGGLYNPVSGVCTDPFRYGLGAPVGSNGYYLDNVHNHRLGGQ